MSQTFGASLRAARERKGISLRQIATATKISVAALESLERNDFSRLPGGIFSRAFVRSYAIEVGLDPDETVRRFLQQFENEDAVPQPAADAPAEAHPAIRQKPLVRRQVAAAEPASEFDFESKQRMAAVVLKLVAVSVPIAAAILYFGSRAAAPTRVREAAPSAARPAAEERATIEPPATPLAASAPPEAAPRPAAEEPAKAADAAITIEIAPSGDCWARLTADGGVVVSRVLKAGERETGTFRDSAILQVGDAAACAILIDGRPARPLGPPRKVREIRITRDNYTTFFP
jgi:cytoskeleton protein RodZ